MHWEMETIEFETPTLSEKGEIIAGTHRTAEQFLQHLGNNIHLAMLVIPSGAFHWLVMLPKAPERKFRAFD